jgi:predicted nucleotidyltransferase component of viral defense system
MISPGDLLEYRAYFMDERQLEKDYLQNLLLYELYLDFSIDLVFKGGTALKMFYSLNRFSEDLDFTYTGAEERGKTIRRFESVFNRFGKMYKIPRLKRRGAAGSLDYELGIAGPLFGRANTLQNIELNISMREKPILEPELKSREPVYQDIPLFSAYVMDTREILAEKVRALFTRKRVKARDIYDIYYLMKFKHVKKNKGIIKDKLSLYSKKFSKTELDERLDSIGRASWKSELSNLIKTVPDYDEVTGYIAEHL